MRTHTYRTVDVPVDGGYLRAGIWEPEAPAPLTQEPPVLAIHGITATHQGWLRLPALLPGRRIIAPDLRGRGRSNTLPGPYGMVRHAADLTALVRHLGLTEVTALGHSMGAFVVVVLQDRQPQLVRDMVLVDGGLPLEIPADADPDLLMRAVLGPALQRLRMTFPDQEAYRDFWSGHPAFSPGLVAELAPYFDYDLEPDGDGWRPTSAVEAVAADQRELVTGDLVHRALAHLATPTTFVHAPRGLLDDAPLYRPEHVRAWAERLPSLTMEWADDVNHYTVVMSAAGARLVAAHLAGRPAADPTMTTEGVRR